MDEESLEALIALDYGRLRMCGASKHKERGVLLDALVANPMFPDEISHLIDLDLPSTLALLAEHEAMGLVTRLMDGRFAPTEDSYLGQNVRH